MSGTGRKDKSPVPLEPAIVAITELDESLSRACRRSKQYRPGLGRAHKSNRARAAAVLCAALDRDAQLAGIVWYALQQLGTSDLSAASAP